jgi:hypothetical protein
MGCILFQLLELCHEANDCSALSRCCRLSACREFYKKYFDDRGWLQCVLHWGANDGPDDAPDIFNRWPRKKTWRAADVSPPVNGAGSKSAGGLTSAARHEAPNGNSGMGVDRGFLQSK